MKEIGGYIELEHYKGRMLHEEALALNCGRNALAYLIKARAIKKIILPYFMCHSVSDLCKSLDVKIRYYHIDEHFLPKDTILDEGEWFYLTDFYGQLLDEDIERLCKKYKRVIVDYAQAYFKKPLDNVDSLYTCRKFLGVPDGAFLYTNIRLKEKILQDESFERMHFLLGRYERTASPFYHEYLENNKMFDSAPILKMSKLTENLLRAIDYKSIKNTRTVNFDCLDNYLQKINLLHLNHAEGAFAYPLYLENGAEIRKKMIEHKIYIPTLWPNVIEDFPEIMYEHQLAKNILPLPCDQRYHEADMEYICQLILKYY